MKYKTLVVVGCSLTFGQYVKYDETWGYLLAKELGLDYVNLGCGGTGWYYAEEVVKTFVLENQENIDDFLFIIQKSELNRRPNYEEVAFIPVQNENLKKYNINLIPRIAYEFIGPKEGVRSCEPIAGFDQYSWVHDFNVPNHRVNPNFRNQWWVDLDNKGEPAPHPNTDIQVESLLTHWGYSIFGLHKFLKEFNVKHILVDGYFPLLSCKMNFKKYDCFNDDEYQLTKDFWSSKSMEGDEDEILLVNHDNPKLINIIDKIDTQNKIDDVVLWMTFFWKAHSTDWNVDGGHPGTKGHQAIKEIILENIKEKYG